MFSQSNFPATRRVWRFCTGIFLAGLAGLVPALTAFGAPEDIAFVREQVPGAFPLSIEGEKKHLWISPKHQGRILAVEAPFLRGASPSWIHHAALSAAELRPKFNPFGGADRIWFGPEGGRFGLFFDADTPPGTPGAWRVPAALDREPFPLVRRSADSAFFRRTMELSNRAGTRFTLVLEREIRLLSNTQALAALPELLNFANDVLAYESRNKVTNVGTDPWTAPEGLLSIWIIGLFEATERTVAMLPLNDTGSRLGLGAIQQGTIGGIPDDRLRVSGSTVFFRVDGAAKGKIGLSPRHSTGFAGAYDPDVGLLTLIQFSPLVENDPYINTAWDDSSPPFGGDCVNIYNGQPEQINGRGKGFFELESSSPALDLAHGAHHTHIHRTFHFVGSPEVLAPVFAAFLNTDPTTATTVFNP